MCCPLDKPVLVLNRNWQPVHTCSVRRSLHMLCTGHARVVQTDGENRFETHDFPSWLAFSGLSGEDEKIHAATIALCLPKVMVLALYDRLPRLEVKFTRRNVFVRDKFTCQYCAKVFPDTQLNLDHVMPRAKGGRTTWENIVTSCFRCNTRKGNKLPQEVGMVPKSKPHAPRWMPLFELHGNFAEDSWRHFLPEVA
ncbi:MAG: HNH endonuclease [Verrucomicrobiota bacterium]